MAAQPKVSSTPGDVLADLPKISSNIVVPLERSFVQQLREYHEVRPVHGWDQLLFSCASNETATLNPHFLTVPREMRTKCRSRGCRIGVNSESFGPGKLLPKQLATGDLLTNGKFVRRSG